MSEAIQLQVELHPEPLWVRADPGMLDQIIINLVVNGTGCDAQGRHRAYRNLCSARFTATTGYLRRMAFNRVIGQVCA